MLARFLPPTWPQSVRWQVPRISYYRPLAAWAQGSRCCLAERDNCDLPAGPSRKKRGRCRAGHRNIGRHSRNGLALCCESRGSADYVRSALLLVARRLTLSLDETRRLNQRRIAGQMKLSTWFSNLVVSAIVLAGESGVPHFRLRSASMPGSWRVSPAAPPTCGCSRAFHLPRHPWVSCDGARRSPCGAGLAFALRTSSAHGACSRAARPAGGAARRPPRHR